MVEKKKKYQDLYEQISADKFPEKPDRVWVNKLQGKATQAGSQWLDDCLRWNLRFLSFLKEMLKDD